MRRTLTLVGTVAAVLVGGAGSAAAATHYAAPNGSAANWPCTSSTTPCDLKTAIEGNGSPKPASGDEVLLENTGDTYTLSGETITAPVAENIESSGGTIEIDASGVTSGSFLTIGGYSQPSELVHVEIFMSGSTDTSAVAANSNTVLDRDLIASNADHSQAVLLSPGAKLLDTVADETGSTSVAVGAKSSDGGTITLRNVTAYDPVTGDAGGVDASTNGCSTTPLTMSLVNVIVDGSRYDLGGNDPCATGGVIDYDVDYSDYLSTGSLFSSNVTLTAAHDITGAPLFADPATYSFAEDKGSPTIDKGTNDPQDGPLDPDGHPRDLGAAPDIGAYEYPAPYPVTGGATNITTGGATLNGSVSEEGADLTTGYKFEYGTSSNPNDLVLSVPIPTGSLAAANEPVSATTPISVPVAGLAPNTTYYYELLADNTDGETFGAVKSFTTAAPQATLRVDFAGNGTGTVNSTPDVGGCDVNCDMTVQTGTSYTLTATADPGSKFAGWSGAGCSGTGTCTVDLGADETATATFIKTAGKPRSKRKPTLSHFTLTGISNHRPKLGFTITHGTGAPDLKSLAITLPTDLKFVSLVKLRVRHAKLRLKHGALTVTLTKAAGSIRLTFAHPAIKTVRNSHPRLTLTVTVRDTAGTATRLTERT